MFALPALPTDSVPATTEVLSSPATTLLEGGSKAMDGDSLEELFAAVNAGEPGARQRLFLATYRDLLAIAGNVMRQQGAGHTLQATALVHEAFIRVSTTPELCLQGRGAFVKLVAKVMSRVLIDHARGKRANKRFHVREPADMAETVPCPTPIDSNDRVALDQAIDRLGEVYPTAAEVVRLRYLQGLTVEQVAEAIGKSIRTVHREWRLAQGWLHRELSPRP